MCLLALLYRVVEDAPLVVGANREEFYNRGGTPPDLLDSPRAIAGLDPLAGGTWFGINAHGVVAAVTNRRKSEHPSSPRSRGLLCRELLGCTSAREAAELAATELQTGRYAGCNFLCADADAALILHAGDWLRVQPLPPGIHVLSNRDLNDPTDPRACHAAGWLEAQSYSHSGAVVRALRTLCASHDPVGSPVCFRHAERGTVCSTILALRPELARSTLLHAQGSPDTEPYLDRSELFVRLSGDSD
jgi:uncharacterized protein with NRDE domain